MARRGQKSQIKVYFTEEAEFREAVFVASKSLKGDGNVVLTLQIAQEMKPRMLALRPFSAAKMAEALAIATRKSECNGVERVARALAPLCNTDSSPIEVIQLSNSTEPLSNPEAEKQKSDGTKTITAWPATFMHATRGQPIERPELECIVLTLARPNGDIEFVAMRMLEGLLVAEALIQNLVAAGSLEARRMARRMKERGLR